MYDAENLKQFEKPFSDLCSISENEKKFQGVIQWNIPNREIKKYLEGAKKPIYSNMFSIGSPSFCSFYFAFHPNIIPSSEYQTFDETLTPPYIKSLSVSIVFNKKLPNSAWVKGKIYFDELNAQEKFSVSGQMFVKEMEMTIPGSYSDFCKLGYLCKDDFGFFVMYCSIKISIREIMCQFDKVKTPFLESRDYDSSKDTFKQRYFSDVSIIIDNQEFMTHKILLAKMPYFQELFDADESKKKFELNDIKPEIFNHILKFLYSGNIRRLSFKLACELYIVASDLKVLDLKNLCASFLGAHLTDTNVLIVMKLSCSYDDIDLKRKCFEFIKASNLESLTENSIII